MPGKPDHALVSMGIYVFATDFLYAELAARCPAARLAATTSAAT
jgi:ADP-glucose pyrophosphorylase